MGIHTEAVLLPAQSPAVLWSPLRENCSSLQLSTPRGRDCPLLIVRSAEAGFGSAQVLGACNLLAECLTPNWMLTNVAAGKDVQVSAVESHDELGAISVGTKTHRLTLQSREFTTALLATAWSIFHHLLSRSC